MKLYELYLTEILSNEINIVTSKNDKESPIFKWRFLLYKDMMKLEVSKTSDMISYSVVTKNNQCIGGMIIFEKPDVKFTKNIKTNVLIQFLFIDKQYRGMGIASNLLKLVIDKYKKVFLVTDQRSSDIAKLMYKKYGFKIIDTRGKFDYWVN